MAPGWRTESTLRGRLRILNLDQPSWNSRGGAPGQRACRGAGKMPTRMPGRGQDAHAAKQAGCLRYNDQAAERILARASLPLVLSGLRTSERSYMATASSVEPARSSASPRLS